MFIGNTMQNVLEFYGFNFGVRTLISFSLIPIWLSAMITNLKFLSMYHMILTITLRRFVFKSSSFNFIFCHFILFQLRSTMLSNRFRVHDCRNFNHILLHYHRLTATFGQSHRHFFYCKTSNVLWHRYLSF